MNQLFILIAIFGFAIMLVACGGEVAQISGEGGEVAKTPVMVGDPAKGEEIYANIDTYRCGFCHSVDGNTSRSGPTLLGISERAGMQVAELSAEEYLRQSILEPSAYVVEGYEDEMNAYELVERAEGDYKKPFTLTGEELDNLIAFLLTK